MFPFAELLKHTLLVGKTEKTGKTGKTEKTGKTGKVEFEKAEKNFETFEVPMILGFAENPFDEDRCSSTLLNESFHGKCGKCGKCGKSETF